MIDLPGSILTFGLGGSPSLMITLGYGIASYGDYPDPSTVLAGTVYGPGGIYTGTLVQGTGGDNYVALRSFTSRHH